MKFCEICRSSYPNDFTTCPKDQAVLRITSELTQGTIIRDKYLILERIGAGGMATVYRARHLAFHEIRAIKVVSTRMMEDDSFIKRFKNEAVITRKLQHPNAVRVDDLDTTEDGRPFIIMEYVEGKDLRHTIEKEGPLALRRALTIAKQVASALAAAHRLGITHRDIKPDNILLMKQPDGSDLVKVLDFGIAKVREGAFETAGYTATQTGMVIGTPQYISPEQAMGKHGEEIDGRADLYSLGVVLYEMLTGQLPFESETPMGLLIAHIQKQPKPPREVRPDLDIPDAVSQLLMKAMTKEREDRFQSADEMFEALSNPWEWSQRNATQPAGTMVIGSDAVEEPVAPPPPSVPVRRTTAVPRATAAAAAAPAPRRVPPPDRLSGRRWGWPVAILLLVVAGVAGWEFYNIELRTPAAASAAPAQPAPTPSPTVTPDDALANLVRQTISQSDFLKNTDLGVAAKDGVVTLTGSLDNQSDAELAGSLASTVTGVRQVDNQIVVKRPAAEQAVKAAAEPKPKRERVAEPPVERGPTRAQKERARQLVTSAKQQVDDGDYDAAIASYQQALATDPKNADAQAGLRRAQEAKQTEEEILRRRR